MKPLIGVLIAVAVGVATFFAGSLLRTRLAPDVGDGSVFSDAKPLTLRALPYEVLVTELEHPESSPAELRAEVDRLCATLVDFFAGRDGLVAGDRLVEIGRPALPRLLSSFRRAGKFDDRKGMINACFVDQTLREIAGDRGPRTPPLKPMANPGPEQIERTVREWYVWWYSWGHIAH